MLEKFVNAIRYHLLKDIESTDDATQKLFEAILAGEPDTIKAAIAAGSNTQLLDEHGIITPLGKAILTMVFESSNAQIIEKILQGNVQETSQIDRDRLTTRSERSQNDRPSSDLTKEYQIGDHSLIFPIDHPLDIYQSTCYRYDLALGYIAQAVFQKYPDSCAIDIGANVGDTAALIQKYQSIPTLCIEGNPKFIKYLQHNAAIVGNIEVEKCFVGRDGLIVNFDNVNTQRGTASIVNAIDVNGCSASPLKSLDTILNEHQRLQNYKLLKIDTDGFDFSIIMSSLDIISKLKPVLYFEYDISFAVTAKTDALNAIAGLVDCGYKKFIIYDNYGNYLLSLSHQESEKFIDLNAYLSSNRYHSGKIAVYYLDICAFPEEDVDLFDQIIKIEIDRSSP
jgi:FkbM family methyltransferase